MCTAMIFGWEKMGPDEAVDILEDGVVVLPRFFALKYVLTYGRKPFWRYNSRTVFYRYRYINTHAR